MPETLAQRVRTKHPGAYDDLSDQALDAAVRAKFPGIYDDLPRSELAATANSRDWSDRIGLNTPTSSPVEGFFRGSMAAAVDMAEGAASGAASTVLHGGDLLRRVTGMERIIDQPWAQRAMHAPENLQGSIGRMAEQGAEFALPLSKIAKATAGMSLARRLGAEAVGSAGIAGVQSGGDEEQMVLAAAAPAVVRGAFGVGRAALGVGQRAAAGAAEGGVGGALAGALRKTAPQSSKVMMVQALKPGNSRIRFEAALDRALPLIKAEATAPITTADELVTAAKAAKARVWAQYAQLPGHRTAAGAAAEVDLTPVAKAMTESITKTARLIQPNKVKAMEAVAEKFRGRFLLEDAEDMLVDANASLESYFAKFPAARGRALHANPATAQILARAESLRKAIYDLLDEPGGGAAAQELKRRYGALLEVQDVAQRRAMVAKRLQPESLSEQIGKVRAAGQLARAGVRALHGDLIGAAGDVASARAGREVATFLKQNQTTDTLIRRAMAGLTAQAAPVAMPAVPIMRPALTAGARQMPASPDSSFARGVPAAPARHEVRGVLPPGVPPRAHGRVFEMPGEVQADPSRVGSVPAAPIAYGIDPTVKVKAGGFRVAQFAGDPEAAKAAIATPEVQILLRRMLADLDTFSPQRGKTIMVGRGGEGFTEGQYVSGVAGSPVGDDIRVISEQNVGNNAIIRAIRDLLKGKPPTNRLHTAALDAAMGYIERRPGYRGPSVPDFAAADDTAFEAFS